MSDISHIARTSLPGAARLGLLCAGLLAGVVAGTYGPLAKSRLVTGETALGAGLAPAGEGAPVQVRGEPAAAAGRGNPAALPVDAARLASLRGSALMAELLPVLTKLTPEDFRAFVRSWVVLTQRGEYYGSEDSAWRLILRHWVEVDPAGVQAWLEAQLQEGFESTDEMHAALTAWLRRWPDAALEWAKARPGSALLRFARSAEFISVELKLRHGIPPAGEDFKALAGRDPKVLIPLLGLMGDPSTWGGFGENPEVDLAAAWARKDVAAALAWARTIPPDRQPGVMQAIGETMEMPALVEFLKTRPKDEQYSLLWTAVQRLRGTDPMAALRLAMEHESGALLERICRPVMLELAEKDPVQAQALFHAMGWPDGSHDLLEKWADADPAAAFAEVAQAGWDSLGNTMAKNLGRDPQAAAWGNSLLEGGVRREFLSDLAKAQAGWDQRAALDTLAMLPEPERISFLEGSQAGWDAAALEHPVL